MKISASCSKFRANYDFKCQINPNIPESFKLQQIIIINSKYDLAGPVHIISRPGCKTC